MFFNQIFNLFFPSFHVPPWQVQEWSGPGVQVGLPLVGSGSETPLSIHESAVCCPELQPLFLPSVDRVMTFPGGTTFTPVNSCCLPLLITGSWTSIRPLMNKIASYHALPHCNLMMLHAVSHTLTVAFLIGPTHCSYRRLQGLKHRFFVGKCLEDLSVMGDSSCKTTAESC